MRVLYISPNSFIGGAEKFLLNTITAQLNDPKMQVSLLCFTTGELTQKLEKLGCKIYSLKNSFKMRNIFTFMRAIFEINEIIKKESPDIVHSTMPYSHIIIGLINLFKTKKFKEIWFQHGPVGGLLDKLASLIPSDLILFNSKYTYHAHNQSALVPSKEAKVLALGFDICEYRESKYLKPLKLCYVGRICSWKGIDTIIKALSLIKDRELQLNIYGQANNDKDHLYQNELLMLVDKLQLHKYVSFHGQVQDVDRILQDCDILIHASKIPEPFGLTVGEAISQSTLVICSNQGGVAELVEHEYTGFSYDATLENASDQLRDLLITVCDSNIDELNKITAAAHKKLMKYFSMKEMLMKLNSIYEKLLNRKIS